MSCAATGARLLGCAPRSNLGAPWVARSIYGAAASGPNHLHHGHGHSPDGRCLPPPCASPPAAPDAPSPDRDQGYCAGLTRRFDYDGYLCSLHLPGVLRPTSLALRALNVELAQAAAAGSRDPSLGLLRLAWWRSALEEAGRPGGRPKDHPVLRALAAAAAAAAASPGGEAAQSLFGGPLGRRWLHRLVEAREASLRRPAGPPPDLASVAGFAESTGGSLLCLLLESAGIRSSAADHAAGHVGAASALTGQLRGVASAARAGHVLLPADLLLAKGVPEESVLRGQASEGLQDVVLQVAAAARGHLRAARALDQGLPPGPARAILLPAVPAGLYLDALEGLNFDVFSPAWAAGERAGVSPAWTQAQLWWHMWRGTY